MNDLAKINHDPVKSTVSRYFIISIFIIVALLIVIPLISIYMLTQAYDEQIRNETNQTSFSLQQTVQSFVEGVYDLTGELAANPSVLTMDGEILTPILVDCAERNDYLVLLYVTGMDGMQIARSSGQLGDRSGRFWFIKMIETEQPFVSPSYYSLTSNMPCTSVFFPMYDDGSDEMAGIFGMDIDLVYLQYLTEQFANRGNGRYSFIIDGEGVVIAHPDNEYLETLTNFKTLIRTVSVMDEHGNPLLNEDTSVVTEEQEFIVSTGFKTVIDDVMNGSNGLSIVEYNDDDYYMSYEPINMPGYSDSWSVITMQNRSTAMSVVSSLVIQVSIIIVFIMAVFITMIVWVLRTLRKTMTNLRIANERVGTMLDASPIGAQLWDENINLIDCNQALVKIFNMASKQEYISRYLELTPEYQPDGKKSSEGLKQYISKAFETGYLQIEWMRQTLDGEPIPVEVTLVRVDYKDKDHIASYYRDLREQKRLIRELNTAQATTSAMFEANPHINILFDSKFNVVDCNPAAIQFMGFNTKEKMLAGFLERITKSIPDFQPGGRSSLSLPDVLKATARDGYFKIDTELIIGDQKKSLTIELIKIPYGNSFGVIAYAYDMTEMRNREKALLIAQDENELQLLKLNAVVKATKIGLWEVGIVDNDLFHPENSFIWSDDFRKMLGYTDENDFPNIFESWKDRLHPEDKDKALNEVVAHVTDATGVTPYDAEYRLMKKDGEYSYFRAYGETIRDNEGFAIHFAGALMDITETKQTMLDNELQLTKTSLMIKATKIGLWDMEIPEEDPFNPTNAFHYSDEVRYMLGYKDTNDFPNIISSWSNLLHPEDSEQTLNAFASHLFDLTGRTNYDVEYRLLKKNGEYSYYRATGETIRDLDGNPIRAAGALIDISEEKNILHNTERLRKEAEAASRSKSNFLANMSHEIRTPMNAIIGMTAIGKKTKETNEKDHALNKIGDASSHLLGIINDVLDMAKIEANKLELSPVEYHFERMLQKVLTVVSFRIEEKKQQLNVNINKNVPRFLIGDEQRLTQIITNLLSNAVKFTPDGGGIQFETTLIGESDGICELQIDITDSGIGISGEQKGRLFHAFEQAEAGTNRQYGGTGLGLAISKRIIELMGGTIWVESELGEGAKFSFTIKVRRSDKSPVSMLSPDINWDNVRILVVDDAADIRVHFKEIFKQLGIRCDAAENGFEACRIIEEFGAYDIYFIDWSMPGMDGIELTRKIKESTLSKPSVVTMITSTNWEKIKDEALQAGVNKCLVKPLMSSTIIDCVNEIIGIANDSDFSTFRTGEFTGRKLLVAEDVEINREILIALLEDTGLIIDCAENGEEALKMVEDDPEKYDLVFMDVQMPFMDGHEATRRIRALPERKRGRLPIVALTANVFTGDIVDCLAAGMDDHLGKPLDIDRVIEKLRKFLKGEN